MNAAALLLAALALPAGGGVRVVAALLPQPPPGAITAAVYLSLRNDGPRDDSLLAVASPLAREAQLHSSQLEGGVMRMRTEAALPLPAGGQFAMHAGGTHVMLTGLVRVPKAGERVPLTLRFAQAGMIQAEATVLPLGSRP